MTDSSRQLAEQLQNRFGDTLLANIDAVGEVPIVVAVDDLIEVATALRDEPAFASPGRLRCDAKLIYLLVPLLTLGLGRQSRCDHCLRLAGIAFLDEGSGPFDLDELVESRLVDDLTFLIFGTHGAIFARRST